MDFMGDLFRFCRYRFYLSGSIWDKPSMFIWPSALCTMYVNSMPDYPAHKSEKKTGGWSTGRKILAGVIIIMVILAMAFLSIGVTVSKTGTTTDFPYVTSYKVALPDGEPVTIGSTRIVVMSYENEVVTDVDGTREKLVVGQERVISPHHAGITLFGVPVHETNFQITLTYRGTTGDKDNFDMTIKTSRQVPEILLGRLIPPSMNAHPVS